MRNLRFYFKQRLYTNIGYDMHGQRGNSASGIHWYNTWKYHYVTCTGLEKESHYGAVEMSVEIDIEDKLYVIKHIREHYSRYKRIEHDWFVLIDRENYTVRYDKAVYQDDSRRYIIHHPDIILFDDENDVAVIIEIDRKDHHTRSGRKKTDLRNQHYAEAGIPNIVIDDEDLKVLQVGWLVFLDSILQQIDRKF